MEKNIEDFRIYLLSKNLSKITIYNYIIWVKIFLEFLDEREINKFNFILFIKEISKNHKPRSIRTIFKILRLYIKFNKYDFLEDLYDVRLPNFEEEPRLILKKQDYEKLQNLLNLESWHGKRNSLIIEIMFKTGLRSHEMLNLKKSSISGNQINVIGKGNKTRIVFVLDDLILKMLNWEFDYFVVDKNGKRLAKSSLYLIIKNLGIMINKDITPHSLRRSFCTNLIKNGCNIAVVQKMMGHTSINTTSKYIFLDKDEMFSEFKKYL